MLLPQPPSTNGVECACTSSPSLHSVRQGLAGGHRHQARAAECAVRPPQRCTTVHHAFSPPLQDIEGIKASLLDPATAKHTLLNALRKLDCYKLVAADIGSTGIRWGGSA